jgi:hypothetical protein
MRSGVRIRVKVSMTGNPEITDPVVPFLPDRVETSGLPTTR